MHEVVDQDILALIPTKNPDFELDEEYLVNIINPQDTLFINGPTAMVWAQCDGETSVAAMIDELVECFPEDVNDIGSDTVSTILLMAERGVICLTSAA